MSISRITRAQQLLVMRPVRPSLCDGNRGHVSSTHVRSLEVQGDLIEDVLGGRGSENQAWRELQAASAAGGGAGSSSHDVDNTTPYNIELHARGISP